MSGKRKTRNKKNTDYLFSNVKKQKQKQRGKLTIRHVNDYKVNANQICTLDGNYKAYASHRYIHRDTHLTNTHSRYMQRRSNENKNKTAEDRAIESK